MAEPIPEQDVAAALVASSVWTPRVLVLGTDVKWGPERDPISPGNDTVEFWCREYFSLRIPFLNAGVAGSRVTSRVQVRVLSSPDARDNGLADAKLVVAALHCHAPSGYYSCLLSPTDGGPKELELNDAGQYEFTCNFELKYVYVN